MFGDTARTSPVAFQTDTVAWWGLQREHLDTQSHGKNSLIGEAPEAFPPTTVQASMRAGQINYLVNLKAFSQHRCGLFRVSNLDAGKRQ